jgi:oxygen-independent coproporphyrinogen-3 oxidase
MHILAQGRVSRISLGAQSFRPEHLKTLERWHNPENIPKSIAIARAAGILRHSIDLIYAIPGQTLDHWRNDLETALALNTDHLSCYNLTYEPHTAMTARLAKGEFQPVDEDLEVDMFLLTTSLLASRGLRRYEVSNYARPGSECRHNLAYWRQDQWLAAGPSASAHVAGCRWKNLPRLDDYLSRKQDDLSFATDVELPDPRRFLGERLMTGLRLAEGVPFNEILHLALPLEPEVIGRVMHVWERGRANGHMTDDASRLVLTDAGILIENRITIDFLRALDPR